MTTATMDPGTATAASSGIAPGTGFGEKFSGWAMIMQTFVGMVTFLGLFDFVPPPSPTLGAEEIATIYRENAASIRLGAVGFHINVGLSFLGITATTAAMMRMRGSHSSLAYMNLLVGGAGFTVTLVAGTMWGVAAFRPEQPAEQLLLLNDLGWIILLIPTPTVLFQWGALGLAILWDDPENPVFPRWFGYYSLWASVFSLGGVAVVLFRTGPFAWDGLFSFYVPFTIAFTWFYLGGYLMIKLGGRMQRGEI